MSQPMSVKPTHYDEMDLTTAQAGGGGEPDRYQSPRRAGRSFGRSAGSIIAGAVLASIVVAVITNLDDIRRYIRISRM